MSLFRVRAAGRISISSMLLASSLAFYINLALPGLDAPVEAKFGRRGKNTHKPADENYETGLKKMRAEDLDGAIDAFSQAIYFARNGYHPEANYWLGVCYMGKGENKKAEDTLLRAISQSVEPMPQAWLAVAELRIRTGQSYMQVRDALNNASKAKANYQQVSYLYGLYSYGRGEYMNAMSHFYRALGDKPWTWTKVWVKYAECKMQLKKWAEANREFNAILNTDTPLKDEPLERLYADIALCKLNLGDHQGAIDHWMRSLDYNKTNHEVWLQLGMLYESEKHYSSAVKAYKNFLRYCPTGDPRGQQCKDRITKIEHMLNPNETAPQPAKPSPYMRQQLDQSMQQQYQRQQVEQQRQQQQMRQEGDSGF
ncbi:tetratricopeptide repeat protein [bacterium]|nr:tetratricopeptide repeat protein [bacterium]